MLPASRSPWWLLVFVVSAAAWIGLLLLSGWLNNGAPPTVATVLPVAQVIAAITGVLALLGGFGMRAAFVGAHVGLAIGWAQMVATFTSSGSESMADLGAVALFLMLGGAGLVVGLIVDVVRLVRAR